VCKEGRSVLYLGTAVKVLVKLNTDHFSKNCLIYCVVYKHSLWNSSHFILSCFFNGNFAIFRTLTEYDTFSLKQLFVSVLHAHRIKRAACLGPFTSSQLRLWPTGTQRNVLLRTCCMWMSDTVTELVVNMNI
jgi:hypothetical protein